MVGLQKIILENISVISKEAYLDGYKLLEGLLILLVIGIAGIIIYNVRKSIMKKKYEKANIIYKLF